MTCQICAARPATHRMILDTMNGRTDLRLCLGCVAGRLRAYPPNSPNVPRDFQETEIMNEKTGGSISEEEMEGLIAEHEWPAYYLSMKDCRPEDLTKHRKCPGVRQPTSHIDPHPTICICSCHPDPDGVLKQYRERISGVKDDPMEDDEDFVFDDTDDEELIWTDDDEDDLVWEDDDFDF